MRLLKPFTAILVLLAVLAPTALAAGKLAKGGRLDSSFGNGGKTLTSSPKTEGGAPRIATTASGKSYVLGGEGFVLYAFGSNGKPDPTFGSHGRIKLPLYASDLAVDPQGRVLVVGTVSTGSNSAPGFPAALPIPADEAEVLRYLPDGSLDPTFAAGGVLRTDFGLPHPTELVNEGVTSKYATYASAYMRGQKISVDAQGRSIIGGSFCESVVGFAEIDRAYVARLSSNGELDPSFGSGGRQILPSSSPSNEVMSLAPTPTSGVVVAVSHASSVPSAGPGATPSLYMLEESGQVSPTFQPQPGRYFGANVVVDPKGRVLLPTGAGVTRLLPDGSLDPSFGNNGTAAPNWISEASPLLTTDAKGRVFVAIHKEGSHEIEVARLGTTGKLDKSFGEGGVVRVGFGSGAGTEAAAASIDSAGRIVVVGAVTGKAFSTGRGLALTRLLPGS
jgi:uncharacterized delta-60 repeat protein